jgi:antitoxin component YwqK of YwqJK toxin-antitoxin module
MNKMISRDLIKPWALIKLAATLDIILRAFFLVNYGNFDSSYGELIFFNALAYGYPTIYLVYSAVLELQGDKRAPRQMFIPIIILAVFLLISYIFGAYTRKFVLITELPIVMIFVVAIEGIRRYKKQSNKLTIIGIALMLALIVANNFRNSYYDKNGIVVTEYYDNGQLKFEGCWQTDGTPDGEWIYYFEDGQKAELIEYDAGLKNGKQIAWYENGNKMYENYFVNNVENGTWFTWYENGNLQEERNFENGIMKGENKIYYEDGSLFFEGNYSEGKIDGQVYYYHENGELNIRSYFVKGKKDGNFYRYDETGQLIEYGTFKNDKKHGIWSEYKYEEGMQITVKETEYIEGKETEKFVRPELLDE